MNKPLVSVIVPTKNSAKTLERCLESIRKQTYPNMEIIVVDNYSTDETREIARKYADKVLMKGNERSAQVNFGVKNSSGKYIYEVGSDFVLEPTVVEEAVELAERLELDGVLIHNTSDPSVSFWAKVRKLERDCYKDDPHHVAVRFLRRDFFERLGGFDERLVAGEDYDLHRRFLEAGGKLGMIKSEEVHIGEPKSLWEIAKKFYYYGKTLGKAGVDRRAVKQLGPLRSSYLRHWKEFVRHPILTIGFLIYNVVKYGCALVGFVRGSLSHER